MIELGQSSRVALRPLQMRPDANQWCVGRVDTGQFAVIGQIAADALRLLGDGLTVAAVADRLRADHERDVDVLAFAGALIDLGFVAAVDGQPVAGPAVAPPTWPRLRPHHVRWTLSPLLPAATAVLAVCACILMATSPELIPTYRDLIWSPHGAVVVLGNAAIGWSTLLGHELGHLTTARAAGVPGRITFGTRLQFLVVQTDVSGIRGAPRRVRITVYLAGIAVDLSIAAAAMIGRAAVGPHSAAGAVLGAVALLALMPLGWQCLVFMRTDLYFVLADLTRCQALYADGAAYVGYLVRRCWRAVTQRSTPSDPSAALPPAERTAVRAYAALLAAGTAACLAFAAAVTLPTAGVLVGRAARGLLGASPLAERLDAAATLVLLTVFWTVWCRAWWRRHGPRITAWSRSRTHRPQLERG